MELEVPAECSKHHFLKILITFFPHIRYYLPMLFSQLTRYFFLNTFNLKRKFHVKAINKKFTEFVYLDVIMEVNIIEIKGRM